MSGQASAMEHEWGLDWARDILCNGRCQDPPLVPVEEVKPQVLRRETMYRCGNRAVVMREHGDGGFSVCLMLREVTGGWVVEREIQVTTLEGFAKLWATLAIM